MIPIDIYTTLLAVAFLLAIYSLIDLDNRIYGNIISAVISAMLFGYLAAISNTGIVGVEDAGIQDLSLQLLLLIPTVIMMGYSGYMILDAWNESKMVKEDE